MFEYKKRIIRFDIFKGKITGNCKNILTFYRCELIVDNQEDTFIKMVVKTIAGW